MEIAESITGSSGDWDSTSTNSLDVSQSEWDKVLSFRDKEQ